MTAEDMKLRAFDRLLAQHRGLKALLDRIDQTLGGRSATVAQIADLLGELGDRLAKHFATEEVDGYFADALAHAPQLVSAANLLLAQHPKMCSAARQILAEGRWSSVPDPGWWDQTTGRFRAFRDELLRHETRENVLLQEAYSQDIGSHD